MKDKDDVELIRSGSWSGPVVVYVDLEVQDDPQIIEWAYSEAIRIHGEDVEIQFIPPYR